MHMRRMRRGKTGKRQGGEEVSTDWKRIQAEMDAAAAAVLADCGVRADALWAEAYGDIYTPTSRAS